MNADTATKIIISLEGGHVNDPDDPGGETKWGISKRAYPGLDIARLTLDDAVRIYRRDYWDRYRVDSLPPKLRLAVFDCAVNCGGETAIALLQSCLGVKTDGVLGPVTRSALEGRKVGDLLPTYLAERALYYKGLATFEKYGRGWFRRLFRVAVMS